MLAGRYLPTGEIDHGQDDESLYYLDAVGAMQKPAHQALLRHLPFLLAAAVEELDKRLGTGECKKIQPAPTEQQSLTAVFIVFLAQLCFAARW